MPGPNSRLVRTKRPILVIWLWKRISFGVQGWEYRFGKMLPWNNYRVKNELHFTAVYRKGFSKPGYFLRQSYIWKRSVSNVLSGSSAGTLSPKKKLPGKNTWSRSKIHSNQKNMLIRTTYLIFCHKDNRNLFSIKCKKTPVLRPWVELPLIAGTTIESICSNLLSWTMRHCRFLWSRKEFVNNAHKHVILQFIWLCNI